MTLKCGSEVTQDHRNRHESANYDFLLTFHSNHGHISHRFRGKRRFQSKIANFPTPVYFAPPQQITLAITLGIPLELGMDAKDLKTEMTGYQKVEKVLSQV